MPPRPRYGEPGWRPRLRRELRGIGYQRDERGGFGCPTHHPVLPPRTGNAPKAPLDLERPDYWREVEAEIYGEPDARGTRHVFAHGPRLRCDYHPHAVFALDEACGTCLDADEEAADDYSGDLDYACRECAKEQDSI